MIDRNRQIFIVEYLFINSIINMGHSLGWYLLRSCKLPIKLLPLFRIKLLKENHFPVLIVNIVSSSYMQLSPINPFQSKFSAGQGK